MTERPKPLTERQFDILAVVDRYNYQNGFPPSSREIGEITGISSTSVVDYNLDKLINYGYASREPKLSRTTRALVSPMEVDLKFRLTEENLPKSRK